MNEPTFRAPTDGAHAADSSSTVARALWIIWALLLGAAMVLGNVDRHSGAPATWCRMGSSLVLVATTVWGWMSWRHSGAGRFACLIAIGMALGTLGDFFNADLLKSIVPLKDSVLGGMISFGLGHIAYIAACNNAARRGQLQNGAARWGSLALWLAIATAGWYVIVYVGAQEKTRDLVWPALPYSLLLASTAGLATGLAVQNPAFLRLAIGAALFFVSDMLLAIGLFRGGLPKSTELVWLTYGPGQMLIVFGALAVCPLLAQAHDSATAGAAR